MGLLSEEVEAEKLAGKYRVPGGYYILIEGFRSTTDKSWWENFGTSDEHYHGFCQVSVYKSVEGEATPHTDPRYQGTKKGTLEHVVTVGSFRIEGAKEMSTDQFLEEVRKGVDGLIKNNEKR